MYVQAFPRYFQMIQVNDKTIDRLKLTSQCYGYKRAFISRWLFFFSEVQQDCNLHVLAIYKEL